MNRNNFRAAYGLANTLYGVSLDLEEFEDIALVGWEMIGNKETRLYRYKADTEHRKITLPCNVDLIEAVYLPGPDSNNMDSITDYNYYNVNVEYYNDLEKKEMNPFFNKGHLAKYRIEGDSIVFDRDYNNVTIIYHGIIVDDDGLPYLSDKELQAIASYVAYVDIYKKSLIRRDGNLVNLANVVKADWLRLCNSARIPTHITQNDMNDVLDVKTRWDRKMYGKSFKPML